MNKNSQTNKLLHLLSNNSRISTKEIAKEIKTSQQNVSYKIFSLTSDKTITSFKLLIESSKFGYNNFCVFLRLKKSNKNYLNKINLELQKYKEITCIDFLFGNYDLFLKFTTPNASNFNKIFKEILNKYSLEFTNYKILTQIVLYSYPCNYLSKKRFSEKIIISGDREYIKVDVLDKQIINILNKNSRTNFAKIANQLNTTSKTIISRVRKLEKKQIIRGYSITLNNNKASINRYYLFLKFNFIDIEHEKQFIKFTQSSPNMIEFIKVFGEWDNIIIIETLKNEDFKDILNQIKEKYSETIIDYSFLESEEVIKWKYLPELEY